MYNVTEKRKYKRIELTKRKDKKIVPPYITRSRVKQYEGQEISSPDWDIVAVKNLSAGGIIFNSYNENLEIGTLLDLKIDFIKSIPTINCIGRVIRIEESRLNSMFRIATEFTEIDELKREMINTTVEAILRKEAKKKNFFLEKLEKMKNAMARKVTMAESKQENSTTLQTINTTKKRRSRKIVTRESNKKYRDKKKVS